MKKIIRKEKNMVSMNELSVHLQCGRARETSELVNQAMAEDYSVETIVKEGFIPGLEALEKRRGQNGIHAPETNLTLRALYRGIGELRRFIGVAPQEPAGTVIIGTVEDDAEETLKNIIAMLMEGRGLEVVDLGTCVSTNDFIRAARKKEAGAIVCLADLVTTMRGMKTLVHALAASGLRERIKIILAGRPVTAHYCRLIGADYYAPDAARAAEIAAGVTAKDPAGQPASAARHSRFSQAKALQNRV
jgi:methanogenic corrinoid protein MtbC1